MDNKPDYDFILSSRANSNKAGFLNGSSPKQRALQVIAFSVVLIILFVVISGFLNASANKSNDKMTELASYQTELRRIIALGNDKTRDASLKNKSLIASYTLESDLRQTITALSRRGVSLPKDYTARYSGNSSDTLLEDAEKSNLYDEKYAEIYAEKLTNYKNKLGDIFNDLSPVDQELVRSYNLNARILLGENLEAVD